VSQVVTVLFLTAVWTALFASLDLRGIAAGAVVSAIILTLTTRLAPPGDGHLQRRVRPRPWGLLVLAAAFLLELVKSALSVAREAWRPKLAVRPGVVAVPIHLTSDVEITMLASLISLTPGTLSLDVSADGRTLYVHALVIDDDGTHIRESIARHLERPVRRAFDVDPR
jgi:multicomponent Na+:H+ antiporter subunit E